MEEVVERVGEPGEGAVRKQSFGSLGLGEAEPGELAGGGPDARH